MTAIDLPKESQTVSAIFASYKKAGDSERQRGYLGASILGHSCARYLWYNFRHCCKPSFDGRMYRLFQTGQLEELRLVADLRAIGCIVHDTDDSGQQFAVSALGGHLSGHMDGCALGVPEAPKTWHVLEFKTHSAKSFAKLTKEGVQKSKPQHYAQMQIYMHLSGMDRALYLARNKDTDDLYSERIRHDKLYCECLLEKANRIITSNSPPERISTREDWYECSYCDTHQLCWGCPGPALPVPSVSCRQCCHATPMMNGIASWKCEKHDRSLSIQDQERACNDHLVLPGLIGFAVPLDSNDACIIFNGESGQWKHGNGGYSTKELTILTESNLANPLIDKAKELFACEVALASPNDILSRYPEGESRIVWKGVEGLLRENWTRLYGGDMRDLTPVSLCEGINYQAAEFPNFGREVEFSGGRVVIKWTDRTSIGEANCEIREGVS